MGAFEEKKPMTKPKTATDVFEIAANQLDAVTTLMQRIDKSATEQFIQTILHAKRIFVTGRGRSSLLTGWFAMRLMQMGFDVHVPGEVTCPRIEKSDLLVTVSCSGSTTTTVDLAHIAAKSGATVIAITAIGDSALAGAAEQKIILPVTDEDIRKQSRYSIGPCNNSLFEQSLAMYFDAIVYSVIEREGISKNQLSKRHTNLE